MIHAQANKNWARLKDLPVPDAYACTGNLESGQGQWQVWRSGGDASFRASAADGDDELGALGLQLCDQRISIWDGFCF